METEVLVWRLKKVNNYTDFWLHSNTEFFNTEKNPPRLILGQILILQYFVISNNKPSQCHLVCTFSTTHVVHFGVSSSTIPLVLMKILEDVFFGRESSGLLFTTARRFSGAPHRYLTHRINTETDIFWSRRNKNTKFHRPTQTDVHAINQACTHSFDTIRVFVHLNIAACTGKSTDSHTLELDCDL